MNYLAQELNATYVKLCEPNATYAQRNSRDSTGCHQNSKFTVKPASQNLAALDLRHP
jgi:hypothetical protein